MCLLVKRFAFTCLPKHKKDASPSPPAFRYYPEYEQCELWKEKFGIGRACNPDEIDDSCGVEASKSGCQDVTPVNDACPECKDELNDDDDDEAGNRTDGWTDLILRMSRFEIVPMSDGDHQYQSSD